MQLLNKVTIGVFSALVLLFTCQPATAKLERRMAIEIHANTIQFAIADVNGKTDKIYRHLDYGSLEAGFYDDLSSSDNRLFSNDMLKKAQRLFEKLRTRQEHFKVVKVRAVAMDIFREAHNAEELVEQVRRTTGIDIRILSPDEADRMDFFSAFTATDNSETPVVWDIGKESFQLIISDSETGPFVHKSDFGFVSFMNYLKEVVQNRPMHFPGSLSPVSTKELEAGIRFARYLARRTPDVIRKELKKDKVKITGIGPVFQEGFAEDIAGHIMSLDKGKLEQFILDQASSGDTNEASLSSAILVFGFMEELDITQLFISDHNSTVGMLEFPILWH
ncbi:hypothetical protein [Endozoicomonas sp. SCSIO W0465]|uniref:Ppx/GppA phosphatase family protein n=1 Tax=Endozoicomonas sp. SCSIO W0465 TaxID=2918516 RepID=UPI002075AD31|nr:hypothetical protein [Endozoicomonas sp. SCSIO W0465]USE34564.1 hypothetical protein MJO57_20805 [Endozoicomonas sp. SCSIO W0465]